VIRLDDKKLVEDNCTVMMKPFSDVTKFHGHICPGSAIGYKAAEAGLNELKSHCSQDDEIVAIVENNSCAVDAVQVLTGCTFGKGNLLFKDHGKQVYTFINRTTNEGVRVSLNDSFNVDILAPQLEKLRGAVNSGIATDLEKEDLKKMTEEVSQEILEIPYNKLFHSEPVEMDIPKKASNFKNVKCSKCGEMVSEHKAIKLEGEITCIPCFKG
jgi:formylmethanofuran dehydrogenase subunit E